MILFPYQQTLFISRTHTSVFAEVSQLCDRIWGFLLRETLRLAARMWSDNSAWDWLFARLGCEAARLHETISFSLPRSNREAILSLTIDSAEAPPTLFDGQSNFSSSQNNQNSVSGKQRNIQKPEIINLCWITLFVYSGRGFCWLKPEDSFQWFFFLSYLLLCNIIAACFVFPLVSSSRALFAAVPLTPSSLLSRAAELISFNNR